VSDERETEGYHRARVERIEALAREIADTINEGPIGKREELRDVAGTVLREDVQINEPPPLEPLPEAAGSFNPFGIGIPLILMGAVMVFLFPPVGLLLFGAAAVMIAWGVATTLLVRS
jgi:hypothetical protein